MMIKICKAQQVQGPYRATVSQELITSMQKCLKILPKTSKDSDEALRYSGRLFQTAEYIA